MIDKDLFANSDEESEISWSSSPIPKEETQLEQSPLQDLMNAAQIKNRKREEEEDEINLINEKQEDEEKKENEAKTNPYKLI